MLEHVGTCWNYRRNSGMTWIFYRFSGIPFGFDFWPSLNAAAQDTVIEMSWEPSVEDYPCRPWNPFERTKDCAESVDISDKSWKSVKVEGLREFNTYTMRWFWKMWNEQLEMDEKGTSEPWKNCRFWSRNAQFFVDLCFGMGELLAKSMPWL